MLDYYADNIYTNDYYLSQYIFRTVFLKKKFCYMLLTQEECNMLKERMPDLVLNCLYSIPETAYIAYEIYSN